jgi:hypothetical protein
MGKRAAASDNRRFLIRLRIPVLLAVGFVATLIVLALTSGDPERTIPVAIGVVVSIVVRSFIERRAPHFAPVLGAS